jgi:hypothetical protein
MNKENTKWFFAVRLTSKKSTKTDLIILAGKKFSLLVYAGRSGGL